MGRKDKISQCSGIGCEIKIDCAHYREYLLDEGYEVPIRFIIPQENCDKFVESDK